MYLAIDVKRIVNERREREKNMNFSNRFVKKKKKKNY